MFNEINDPAISESILNLVSGIVMLPHCAGGVIIAMVWKDRVRTRTHMIVFSILLSVGMLLIGTLNFMGVLAHLSPQYPLFFTVFPYLTAMMVLFILIDQLLPKVLPNMNKWGYFVAKLIGWKIIVFPMMILHPSFSWITAFSLKAVSLVLSSLIELIGKNQTIKTHIK